MKGLLKLLAGLAALIVVVIVAGGAILGTFFDPNEYKPEIEQAALDNAGVELKINGDIGWSVFPWLGLEVNKIDAKFPGKQDLAKLNQAQISVRLPALLSGNVEMQSVVVDGLELNLVQEKDGSNNWAVAAAPTDAQKDTVTTDAAPKEESAKSTSAPIAINIDSIQISNGNIIYQDKAADMVAKLTEFNMSSGQVVTNAFFPAELSFNASQTVKGEEQVKAAAKLAAEFYLDLEKQQYKLKGLTSELDLSGKPLGGKSLALNTAADIEADLLKQQLSLNNLKLSIANLNAEGALTVNNFAAPAISGKLNVAAFDLNKLLSAVGQSEVKTNDPNALKAISLSTELEGPANTITAKALTVKLDDTTFNGSAAFNLANSNITLNLQGDKINADRYMPPAAKGEKATGSSNRATSGTAKKGQSSPYSKEPILPVEALRGLELDTTLGLKSLHVSNMDISNVALQVSAHSGLIKATKIDADLYKGSVRNNVTVDVRKNTPIITSKKAITGIQVGDLLKDMANVDQLTGKLNSTSNLTLRGNSVHDFVNSVTGTVKVNMKDGELKGLDMAQSVCQGLNNVSALGGEAEQVDRSTPFTSMGASARIKNGLVSNKDLKAALDAMALSGKGTVNLPKQLLDYRLGFMVEKNLFKETCSFPNKLEGVEVPIDCKGSFNTEPTQLCKPDFSFITDAIKQNVKKKVEEKKEKLKAKAEEKLKDKLGDKLKGLF
ncbi:AsmA family protein [Neptuniibacter sp. QD29_5]|uniref:AsmA family protein n=1 Tax=Neptuniibacter sp. QD29_5 TaxID=3398207 RepID=UPI0039F58239